MFEWAKRTIGLDWPAEQGDGTSPSGMLITGHAGFIAGTHVVSNLGWRAIETLHVGDKVLSFDHGMQPIVDIQHDVHRVPEHLHYTDQCPVLIPTGSLRNRRPLWLMPDQGMLVESDIVMDDTGDPFAIVPAKALLGHRGIELAPIAEYVNVTTIVFRHHEAIYVEGGLLAHCPNPSSLTVTEMAMGAGYQVLNLRAAKFLVACEMDEPEPEGLTYHPEEIAAVLKRQERPSRPV